MKKFLVPLLCAIPFIANAVTIGGFEFKKEDVLVQDPKEGYSLLIYRENDVTSWIGIYFKEHFQFYKRARGQNKAWNLLSAEKGKFLASDKKFRSWLALYEIDCVEGRTKLLKLTAYSGYFHKGTATPVNIHHQDWQYSSDSDINMAFGCDAPKYLNENK